MPDDIFVSISSDALRIDLMNVGLTGVVIAIVVEEWIIVANAAVITLEVVSPVSCAKDMCAGIMIDLLVWGSAVIRVAPGVGVEIILGVDTII